MALTWKVKDQIDTPTDKYKTETTEGDVYEFYCHLCDIKL